MQTNVQNENGPMATTVYLQTRRRPILHVLFDATRAMLVSTLFLFLMTRITFSNALANLRSTLI